jgi:hypothetical protein
MEPGMRKAFTGFRDMGESARFVHLVRANVTTKCGHPKGMCDIRARVAASEFEWK